MTWAVVRVRGPINVKPKARETMRLLRLNRVNHCVMVPEDATHLGMLRQVKDYVTWGEADAETADRLIHDKLTEADWGRHLGQSESLFVNFSTWALMLTGRVIDVDDEALRDPGAAVKRLVAKSGEPVIRRAMIQAMRILGRQFVMGRTIGEALSRAREEEDRGDRFSFDMLGEAARTADDAERYFQAYADAIGAIADNATGADVIEKPGISVKLSALHPRYELAQRHQGRDSADATMLYVQPRPAPN